MLFFLNFVYTHSILNNKYTKNTTERNGNKITPESINKFPDNIILKLQALHMQCMPFIYNRG